MGRDDSGIPLGRPGAAAQDALLELERKSLGLRVLLEVSRELSGLLQPRKILETFLLTAMGPLGAVRGATVLVRPASCEGMAVCRGLSPVEVQALEQGLESVCDAYFPYRDVESSLPDSNIRVLWRRPGEAQGVLPQDMDVLLTWSVDEEQCGLLALGPRLSAESGEPLGQADEDLLHCLVHILIGALRGALTVNSIRQLSADVNRKNEWLAEALAESRAAKLGLDRRVHQLSAINQLAGELAHLDAVDEILDRFLLTMQGAFGSSSGLVLVLDRQARQASQALRGAPGREPVDFAAADALIYRAFTATGRRSVDPMTVEAVEAPAQALAETGLGFEPSCAAYFALSAEVQGVFILGPTLSGEPLGQVERQLLLAQTGSLLGFVEGARRMATITLLNKDLNVRNEELSRTVAELSQAHQTIDLLERAGERVRSFLAAEGQRSRRFSWLDCGVILTASVLLALLFNLASPAGLPLLPEHLRRPSAPAVSAQKARELVESEGALVVDARPRPFFEQGHIRGALNLSPALFDMVYLMRLAQTPLDRPIVVYGGNISRRWDEDVAVRLRAREHERVLVLEDGLEAWAARGYPVEP